MQSHKVNTAVRFFTPYSHLRALLLCLILDPALCKESFLEEWGVESSLPSLGEAIRCGIRTHTQSGQMAEVSLQTFFFFSSFKCLPLDAEKQQTSS